MNRLQERAVWDALELAGSWTDVGRLRRRTGMVPKVLLRALRRLMARGLVECSPLQPTGEHGRTYLFRRSFPGPRKVGALSREES